MSLHDEFLVNNIIFNKLLIAYRTGLSIFVLYQKLILTTDRASCDIGLQISSALKECFCIQLLPYEYENIFT